MFSWLRRLRRTTPAPVSVPLAAVPPLSAADCQSQRERSQSWPYQPLISVLTPVYRPPLDVLRAAVDSVLAQSYSRWQLCLVCDSQEPAAVRDYLASLQDPRIHVHTLPANLGIAGNSNEALAQASGEFVALLDHDDALAPAALFEMVQVLQDYPHTDVLYSDKDSFGIDTVLKPQWSPELLWSSSYLTHFTVLRTSLVQDAGGFRTETEGAQDWDLFLRAITRSAVVRHVPGILYHWRIIATSTAAGMAVKPYAAAAQLRAVDDHLQRLQLPARAVFDEHQQVRIRWEQPERQSVSILLLGGDARKAELLRQKLRYAAFEVLGVPRPSVADIQAAARRSTGQCLLLLDRHIQIPHEAFLQDVIPPLQHPGIGASAPLLLDPYTHQIRHAGFAFARDGSLLTPYTGETVGQYSALGRNDWYRNRTALSGACLAVRRDAFDASGGFRVQPWHDRPDIDLCLRLQFVANVRLLLNASAFCEQHGSAWCDRKAAARPDLFPQGDPYFHPWLDPTAAPSLAARGSALPGGAPPLAARAVSRDIAWVLPSGAPALSYRPLLAAADQVFQSARVRSWFLIDGPEPAPLVRRRIASLYPRLAADCSFEAIPVGAVVAAGLAQVALAATVPGVARRYVMHAGELSPELVGPLARLQFEPIQSPEAVSDSGC